MGKRKENRKSVPTTDLHRLTQILSLFSIKLQSLNPELRFLLDISLRNAKRNDSSRRQFFITLQYCIFAKGNVPIEMTNETWKKWLSYLVPQTKYIESEVSGRLEVGWRDGKKVLDNGRVNYSYGGLQKVLSYGLEQIPLESVRSVLVLGMGGGSVIESLRTKFKYTHPIVAVEIDPVVIEIAEEEFGIAAYNDLEVFCIDAAQFLKESKQSFDLIIVDLFIGEYVPERFYGKDFWQDIERRTNNGGKVLFNAEVKLTNLVQDTFLKNLPETFSYEVLTDVMGGNTLIVLDKKV